MNPRCEHGKRQWDTVNGKPKHMQCRKRGIGAFAVQMFVGHQVDMKLGMVPIYTTVGEWRCQDHKDAP